jgi:hypothetical protein
VAARQRSDQPDWRTSRTRFGLLVRAGTLSRRCAAEAGERAAGLVPGPNSATTTEDRLPRQRVARVNFV